MPAVHFTYPRHVSSPTLTIDTGANKIAWAYDLNTQSYATYGGEVVQVLSTSIDTITIEGEVRSYSKMEHIYKWFLFYIQDATQGFEGRAGYSEEPVVMTYPERGWKLQIQPISLPGMRYGRDVVVPTWQMQAHVIDPDPRIQELTIDESIREKKNFRHLTADVGYRLANPYGDPLGKPTADEVKIFGEPGNPTEELTGVSKTLSDMLDSYTQQEFVTIVDQMDAEASRPATQSKNNDNPDKEKPGK